MSSLAICRSTQTMLQCAPHIVPPTVRGAPHECPATSRRPCVSAVVHHTQVRSHFASCGKVLFVRFATTKTKGAKAKSHHAAEIPAGYAFVIFEDPVTLAPTHRLQSRVLCTAIRTRTHHSVYLMTDLGRFDPCYAGWSWSGCARGHCFGRLDAVRAHHLGGAGCREVEALCRRGGEAWQRPATARKEAGGGP